jgi:hypothetical protein
MTEKLTRAFIIKSTALQGKRDAPFTPIEFIMHLNTLNAHHLYLLKARY